MKIRPKVKKIAVIGNFAGGKPTVDGQTVKTRVLTDSLIQEYGKENITIFDTIGGIWTLFRVPYIVFVALAKCRNIVILPAHNAVRVFVPLLAFLQILFRDRRVHYVVIGGWLPIFLKGKKVLADSLRKIYMIYAETTSMVKALKDMGYTNVTYMPNFKPLRIVSESSLDKKYFEPYHICTFSRVWSMKGIAEAADAVMYVNSKLGRNVFDLDIYGKIEKGEEGWFDTLMSKVSNKVRYKGIIAFDKSVQVLKNYVFMLFPTKCVGEGIPGTIIDAYAAGLPVVSSFYPNFAEIIEEGVTGFGYEFNNNDAFKSLLLRIAENPDMIISLKKNCVKKAAKYQPETILKILTSNF